MNVMKKYTLRNLILLIAAGFGLAQCDNYGQDEYEEQVVVEAFLVAMEPLPLLRLSRTAEFAEFYRFEDFAISDGIVRIHEMNGDAIVNTYEYREGDPGVYEATTNALVRPLTTYALDVDIPSRGDRLSATTVVPDTFSTVGANLDPAQRDSVVYQQEDRFEIVTTRSEFPGRQAVFIFSIFAEEPESFPLTPFYADDVDDPEDVIINSSGIINEGNYEFNPDGTLTISLPWIAIAYFGPNTIVANTLDDNLVDFYRSLGVQFGDSFASPGEIYNVIERIDGGTGIFGSYARAAVPIFVRPRVEDGI